MLKSDTLVNVGFGQANHHYATPATNPPKHEKVLVQITGICDLVILVASCYREDLYDFPAIPNSILILTIGRCHEIAPWKLY